MIIIDFLFEHKNAILVNVISGLILIVIIKYHKPIMDFVGKTVKFSQVYITPLMFIVIAWIDQKYNLQEKQILTILFCGLGMAFGYLYRLAENIDNKKTIR